jgi:hypothetical protein
MDNENLDVWFFEGPGPTDTWLKDCVIVGKPGGKRRNKPQPAVLGETGLLDTKIYCVFLPR